MNASAATSTGRRSGRLTVVNPRSPNPYTALKPSSLPEFDLYEPRSGHPDWRRLADEAKQLATDLRGQLEAPRSPLAYRRRRLAANATATTNYVINRRRSSEGREDLLPLFFIWTLLRTCNYRCEYCDDHRGRKYPELSNRGVLDTQQARRLLEVMRTRTPSIYLAGGEPTLRKDLPEITRLARELDFYPITVNTNGSVLHKLLEREAWRSWLADTDIIVVSLDALELDLLDGMWGTRRSQDVLRNILMLRELATQMRFKLMINTVIQPGHIRHARDVLDFANDMGLWFTPVPMNLGPRVGAGLLADPAYEALAELILSRKQQGHRVTGSRRMNRRLLHAQPLSCRNTLKPHIDYDGRLMWPCKASVGVEPIPINVLDFEHVDDLYAHARLQRDPTGFHGQGEGQCGADCNWAQNYATDAYAYGLRHPVSLLREAAAYVRAG